jgi:hypothetical protein
MESARRPLRSSTTYNWTRPDVFPTQRARSTRSSCVAIDEFEAIRCESQDAGSIETAEPRKQ